MGKDENISNTTKSWAGKLGGPEWYWNRGRDEDPRLINDGRRGTRKTG